MGTGLRSHARRFLRGTVARVLRVVAYDVIGAVLIDGAAMNESLLLAST